MSLYRVSSKIAGPLIFIAIGMSFIGIGAVLAWKNYSFIQQAALVPGEVISLEERGERSPEGLRTVIYAPKVRFSTPQGQTLEFYGPSSRFREYEQGQRVEVLYLPEQPEDARIKTFNWWWLMAGALAGAGFVFIGIAWRVAFAGRENTRRINKPEKRIRRARGLR